MDQHFSAEEREELAKRLLLGESKASIARILGRARSSIFRELKRNSGGNGYRAVAAQVLAEQRRRQPRQKPKMESPELRAYVELGLSNYWSPKQIAGRSRIDFPQDCRRQVSYQTIYVWINRQEHLHWRRCLRSTAWPKSPRRSAPYATAVSIAGRPAVVAERSRYGDWEGDTLRGRQGSGGLSTLVERRGGQVDDCQRRQTGAERHLNWQPVLQHHFSLREGECLLGRPPVYSLRARRTSARPASNARCPPKVVRAGDRALGAILVRRIQGR